MTDFIVSDTHWGHQNILKYEPIRTLFAKDIIEHDEELVRRWNEVVGPKDTVYHLGDVCFGGTKNLSFIGRCNGDKILILGNHDSYGTLFDYQPYFKKICAANVYKGHYLMTHVPVHPSQFYRFKQNLHGHCHSTNLLDLRYLNCSIENLPNFQPVNLTKWIKDRERAIDKLGLSAKVIEQTT
jgi:calcineurin-like phosphoesterase family protein